MICEKIPSFSRLISKQRPQAARSTPAPSEISRCCDPKGVVNWISCWASNRDHLKEDNLKFFKKQFGSVLPVPKCPTLNLLQADIIKLNFDPPFLDCNIWRYMVFTFSIWQFVDSAFPTFPSQGFLGAPCTTGWGTVCGSATRAGPGRSGFGKGMRGWGKGLILGDWFVGYFVGWDHVVSFLIFLKFLGCFMKLSTKTLEIRKDFCKLCFFLLCPWTSNCISWP